MKVIKGNIWDYWKQGNWIVIPTNGYIKKDGSCVMGRGLALQAKLKFPKLAKELGDRIKSCNDCQIFDYRIVTFPVKKNWWEKADLKLIEESAKDLQCLIIDRDYCNCCKNIKEIYLPKVGCGNGRLNWKNDVEPILDKYLDERFIVVEK